MRKMILIGAGSAMFTMGLLADIIKDKFLGPWEIGLVDTDPEALTVAYNLAKKMVDVKDANIKIEQSTDRKDLLPNADLVITTIGVGGRRAWETDVFIPRKYGIYQPVGDTVGPGGLSRAMRMIPAMKEIAEDILKLCPDALFINYANPMTAICRALRKSTGIKVAGLCIGVYEVEKQLAEVLGVSHQEVTSVAIGLNHLTFIIDFRHKGENVFPRLRQRVEETGRINKNPFSWSLFDMYGAYPAVNDVHVVEFFLEKFPNGKYYHGKTLGIDVFSVEKNIERGDSIYAEMTKLSKAETRLNSEVFSKFSGEHSQTLEIITSIYNDQRKIFSANLPNNGAIPNLPSYAVLEMPAVASGKGFLPLRIDYFPDSLAAIINQRLACVELTVDAALEGNRKLMVEAMLVDGAVRDKNTAEKLTNELLKAHKGFLPQFS
ncbi:Alpha-galactosidase [subsurface metagenome]